MGAESWKRSDRRNRQSQVIQRKYPQHSSGVERFYDGPACDLEPSRFISGAEEDVGDEEPAQHKKKTDTRGSW